MLGIGRRSVLTDRRTRGIVGVEAVVAVGAEAPERAEPECIEIAAMGFDMVRDRCRHDAIALKAKRAQRFDHELMTASPLPARGAIPAVDFGTVRHRGARFGLRLSSNSSSSRS